MGCKLKIPKIYIEKPAKDGKSILLVEFPKGKKGKRMWDKILLKVRGKVNV